MSHSRLTGGLSLGLAAFGTAALLSACSSSGGDQPASGASSAGAGTALSGPAAAPGTSATISVTETEFHLALSKSSVAAGAVNFLVRNAGHITHALTIDGPGVEDDTTKSLSPGQSAKLTVTMKAGKYDVYCPVGNHKMEGMDTSVSVS